MRFKILVYAISIIVISLLQSTITDYLKVFNVKPSLPLVFVVCVALLTGPVEGAVVGFFTGLAVDMLAGGMLGVHILMDMYLGLFAGLLNKRLYRENIFVVIFFSFVSTVVYELLAYLFSSIGEMSDFVFALRHIVLPEAAYNSIAAILVFIIVVRLNYRIDDVGKAARKY